MSLLHVEVVYARADRQVLRQIEVPQGATASEAVVASGIWMEFPELNPAAGQFARYGRLISRLEPVRDGDRIEILRPLLVDPKEARRMSAAKSRRKYSGAVPRR